MLKQNKEYFNVALVGSTSEIGLAILSMIKISNQGNIILVGRKKPKNLELHEINYKIKFIYCDLLNNQSVEAALSNLHNNFRIDLLIYAAGYLPDENNHFDFHSRNSAFQVNALSATHIIAITSEVMAKHGSGDILLISSVASLRARPRNFVYGSSKAFADFFALGLSYRLRGTGVFICIIRPGFTFTKLTSKMKPNPFALTPNEVGAIAVRGLNSRKRIVYTPRKLKIIMNFLRITPRFIFNKI